MNFEITKKDIVLFGKILAYTIAIGWIFYSGETYNKSTVTGSCLLVYLLSK